MRIFLTGGTGYLGQPVVGRLVAAGHELTALARSDHSAEVLTRAGVSPLRGDLEDPPSFAAAALDHDAVVHLAASDRNDRLEVDRRAIEALLRSATASSRLRSVVYTSVLFLLGDTGDTPADESTPLRPPPHLRVRAATESFVLDSATPRISTAIIRPGMVYGGGNGGVVSEMFRSAVEDGDVPIVGPGDNHWPLVHREDVAALYQIVIEKSASGVFHAVDGHVITAKEVALAVAEAATGGTSMVRSVPLEDARRTLGTFADSLRLDQIVTAPHARSLGWNARWDRLPDVVDRAFQEWRRGGDELEPTS